MLDHYYFILDILRISTNANVVYLDFSKAFDVVDHHLLLKKLKGFGMTAKVGKWIHAFLTDRKQNV